MPLPVRRNARRLNPWRRAACSLIWARRASYSFCCGDCGGGMNSSLETIRAGIGGGASVWASRSHWRTHMVGLLELDFFDVSAKRVGFSVQSQYHRPDCEPYNEPLSLLATSAREGELPSLYVFYGCRRNPPGHENVWQAHGRQGLKPGSPRRNRLWIYRSERLRKDDHAPHDHAHSAPGLRRDPCAGRERPGRGQRSGWLLAGRAGAVQADESPRCALLLCRAQGVSG